MVRMILGCCLAIVGVGGGNGFLVTVGMVVEVETIPVELQVVGWEV
jgi:hypothetical protein